MMAEAGVRTGNVNAIEFALKVYLGNPIMVQGGGILQLSGY